jgi:hypothetical protein
VEEPIAETTERWYGTSTAQDVLAGGVLRRAIFPATAGGGLN